MTLPLPCPHHWDLGDGAATVMGTCRFCGQVRTFQNYLPEMDAIGTITNLGESSRIGAYVKSKPRLRPKKADRLGDEDMDSMDDAGGAPWYLQDSEAWSGPEERLGR